MTPMFSPLVTYRYLTNTLMFTRPFSGCNPKYDLDLHSVMVHSNDWLLLNGAPTHSAATHTTGAEKCV